MITVKKRKCELHKKGEKLEIDRVKMKLTIYLSKWRILYCAALSVSTVNSAKFLSENVPIFPVKMCQYFK